MKKYRDLNVLQQIKQWVHDPDRPTMNHLAKELSYPDFNKYGRFLLRMVGAPDDEIQGMIESIAQEIEASNIKITKANFSHVANFVFDIKPKQALGLKAYLPEHSDVWDGLAALDELVRNPNLLTDDLTQLQKDFLTTRANLNKMNLESVMLAGMVIFICSHINNYTGAEENLTETFCIPILGAMGLPESASTVSRYRVRFDDFIKDFYEPEPEEPFSEAWNDWWSEFRTQIQSACRTDLKRFAGCATRIRQLPGGKNLLPEFEDQASSSTQHTSAGISRDEKLQNRIKKFNSLEPVARKKVLKQALDKAFLEFEFLSKAEADLGEFSVAFADLRKVVNELSLKFD